MNNLKITEIINKESYTIEDLREIFAYLRSENGCPWDRQQTHESIRANLIEETYEVIEALDNADSVLMREELGDLLLQVVFHARLEEEAGRFTLDDVIHDIAAKLVRRHPHVFGTVEASDAEGALGAWEAAKGEEKTERVTAKDKMKAVPEALPALMRAQKVMKKAQKEGFDDGELLKSGAESLRALATAMENGMPCTAQSIADALLATASYAQHASVDCEELLSKRVAAFIESY